MPKRERAILINLSAKALEKLQGVGEVGRVWEVHTSMSIYLIEAIGGGF